MACLLWPWCCGFLFSGSVPILHLVVVVLLNSEPDAIDSATIELRLSQPEWYSSNEDTPLGDLLYGFFFFLYWIDECL